MKKCAVINDISGFGNCSLTAAVPIITSMGIRVNPIVTGVFTNQTGYDDFASADLTDLIPQFTVQWKKLGARFDGILTGFLMHEKQYEYVIDFINEFKTPQTLLLVDPVMADDGAVYEIYTPQMVEGVKKLCTMADVITPNVTELAVLTGEKEIEPAAKMLLSGGIKAVIVTGAVEGGRVCNYVFTNEKSEKITSEFIEKSAQGGSFSGTGDIFASFVLGRLLCGTDVFAAVSQAADFIGNAIKTSDIKNRNDGIDFEPYLNTI